MSDHSSSPDHVGDDTLWLRLLSEACTEGVLVHENGIVRRVNATLARMLRYEPAALVGMPGTALTVPADRARLMAHIAAGGTAPLIGTALRADGTTFSVEILGRTLHVGGRTVRVVIMRDTTERDRAEADRRSADATLRGLLDQSLTGVYVIQDGRFVYVNDRFAEIFGFAHPVEVLGLPTAVELLHPDDRAKAERVLAERLAGTPGVQRFRGLRRDGRLVHLEAHARRGEHGGRVAVVGSMLDVTDGALASEAVAASEKRFRALVEHASDLIAILDADGTNRYASPSHEVVLGVRPADLIGQSCFDWTHEPADAALLHRDFDEAMRTPGPTAPALIHFRHRDGSRRLLEVVLTDMRADPAVAGIVANTRDVTAQHALEEQLRQAQKMEAIGQLAGGVAHDFNNVLAVVAGYAQLLRAETPPDDARLASVEEIARAAERGAAVTRQLLSFSRRQEVRAETLDLAAVAREMAGMLRALVPPSIAVEFPAPDAAPVWVRAARAPLEQVVMNLALNARDAMPRGGRVAIGVVAVPVPRGGPRALLTVADNGEGIPAAIRDRIFEPFFTTKPAGRGTGLGLATVYGFVRQFHGSIELSSEPGRGTTFTVGFPLAEPPAEERTAPASDGGAAPPRARRVLLVEDEGAVRAVATRMLERAGYAVTAAEHGAAALAALREAAAAGGAHFDVVVTDSAMPVMGGRELAAALAEAGGPPVVMMSGFTEPGAETPPGVAAFVDKPFTAAVLLAAVDAATGVTPAGPAANSAANSAANREAGARDA